MTPENFVDSVRKGIIEDDYQIYREYLSAGKIEEINDPYWRGVIELYQSLDDRGRNILLSVFRQVTVDTVSAVFGYLDGTSFIDDNRGRFALTYEDGMPLNGDLQDILLEKEQDEEEKKDI